MRLGLTSAAFYGRMETEDAAGFLTQLDIDCCEVFLETFSEYSADFAATVRRNLGNLPCVSVHPKGTQFEPDLFGQSARQRDDALHTFTRVLDAGQQLGAKYYVLHGPVSVIGRVTLPRIRALEERFDMMREAARAHGIEILWENVYYGAVSSADDFRAILARLPDLNFVLDVKQAWRGQADPIALAREFGGRIRHLHLLDRTAAGDICLPGDGCFDIPLLLRVLADSGYTGDVIIEPYAYQTEDGDALRRSIGYVRNLIARIGG